MTADVAAGPDWLDAIWLGLVEGITEFLPVSSTGHLIVAERGLDLHAGEANNVFAIGIQIGAITAVLVLYWRRLLAASKNVFRRRPGEHNLLWQIAVAAMPAIVVGLLADDWIDSNLFSPSVVAATMVIGGVLLLLLERMLQHRGDGRADLATMPYVTAVGIGLFQCLALVPGTSRSGATIAGAMLLGMSRTAAAEFSFLVGLPILYGAACYKLLGHAELLAGDALLPFVIGTVVSFVSALAVIRPFVRFLQRHTFAPFAWYRIVAGSGLAVLCWSGYFAE
ncbi:MAG: undecaprenyl-diphosphate phosphatase [Planctomycetes bacterium]|nr:undecaprenyl-diphosphate phosphatase [Planctomycetota bacterium]